MKANELVKKMKSAKTRAALDKLLPKDETRKTVLKAYSDRLEDFTAAEEKSKDAEITKAESGVFYVVLTQKEASGKKCCIQITAAERKEETAAERVDAWAKSKYPHLIDSIEKSLPADAAKPEVVTI